MRFKVIHARKRGSPTPALARLHSRRPDTTHTSSAGWFLSLLGNAMPPRDPNADDDDDEDEEDEREERKSDQPAVIREPNEDE
jgi:hypothetical protein